VEETKGDRRKGQSTTDSCDGDPNRAYGPGMSSVVDVVPFGVLTSPDAFGRRHVSLIPLRSSAAAVSVLTLGATLHTVEVPDRTGRLDHVALHLPTVDELADRLRNPYLGATCGRVANRIGGSAFTLDDEVVTLEPNDGDHQLHGGPDGFDRRIWELVEAVATDDGGVAVLALTSPHGDQGYPGTMEATATYELHGHTLRITYEAITDAPTVCNLTNHAYWNLGGMASWDLHRSVGDHELRVPSHRYLPVDATSIPDGPLVPVDQTPFDLRQPRLLADLLAEHRDGIDHAYAVPSAGDGDLATPDGLQFAAELHHGASGRTLTVATDQPALQVYTANGLGAPFAPQAAVCLETQRFPDAPNRPDLGSAVLRHGEHYRSVTELTFGIR
jgi:aldose 1-epimerase